MYRTKPNLSESINAAISHRDMVLDVEVDGSVVGKIIIYNNETQILQSEKQTAIYVIIAALLVQGDMITKSQSPQNTQKKMDLRSEMKPILTHSIWR